MSYIDKRETIEAYTNATLDSLEKVLKSLGYKVTRSNISITAILKTFSGHNSNILIVDQNGIRYCKDTETCSGLLLRPKVDRLQDIIREAEKI